MEEAEEPLVYSIPERYPTGPAVGSLMGGWLKFLLHTRNFLPQPLDLLCTEVEAEAPPNLTGIQMRRYETKHINAA